MFDLTPALAVETRYRRVYGWLRGLLYVSFFIAALFVGVRFIFPDEQRFFDFRIYFGPKNTLANPRLENGTPIAQGMIEGKQAMLWNASAVGAFSLARLRLDLEGGAYAGTPLPGGTISIVRAYRAFLYPAGDPVGFRSGTLLSDNTRYGIVSAGVLRPFTSLEQAQTLGWNQTSFLSVSADVWDAYAPGTLITDESELIEDSLVRVNDNYYQVRGNELVPFVSARAYRSRFPETAARVGGEELLKRTTRTETMVGFLDGTLLSYDQSVYAVAGATLRPIASADIFLEKGYRWESVIAATGEEFGIYVRGKLYTRNEPHPDGTLFFAQYEKKLYLVENGTKRPIQSDALLAQYGSITPVVVDSVPETRECALRYNAFWQRLECEIALDTLAESQVGEYQLAFLSASPIRLKEMRVDFIRLINEKNFRYFLTDLRQKIAFRYEQ